MPTLQYVWCDSERNPYFWILEQINLHRYEFPDDLQTLVEILANTASMPSQAGDPEWFEGHCGAHGFSECPETCTHCGKRKEVLPGMPQEEEELSNSPQEVRGWGGGSL